MAYEFSLLIGNVRTKSDSSLKDFFCLTPASWLGGCPRNRPETPSRGIQEAISAGSWRVAEFSVALGQNWIRESELTTDSIGGLCWYALGPKR